MHYNFSKGRIIRLNPMEVRLEDGTVVCVKQFGRPSWSAVLDEPVRVAWCSKGEDVSKPRLFEGKYWVDPDAIESLSAWKVESFYSRTFGRDDATPYQAEEKIVRLLNDYGIMADPSTPFEDERLGIDLWLFLKLDNVWRWYPVDITLMRDTDIHLEAKVNGAFEKGVILVQVERLSLDNPEQLFAEFIHSFNHGYELFRLYHKSLLSRREAVSKENEMFGSEELVVC